MRIAESAAISSCGASRRITYLADSPLSGESWGFPPSAATYVGISSFLYGRCGVPRKKSQVYERKTLGSWLAYLIANTTLSNYHLTNTGTCYNYCWFWAPCLCAPPLMGARREVLSTSSTSTYPSQLLSYKQVTPFAQPLFSTTYELPNLQALCFQVHTNCRGVWGAPTSCSFSL